MEFPVDPDLLATFLAVVEEGRISQAARNLHLSQPAVSSRMARLEKALGTTLLERSATGVVPTPAGERLAKRARELARVLELAVEETRETPELGRLELIASTTIASYALPWVLAAYRARYPKVDLAVRIGNTEEVIEAVREQRVGLGLVEGLKRAPGIRLEPWIHDEILLVCGREAPSHWRFREPGDLAEVPILWREAGSGTRAVVARALKQAGLRSKPGRQDLVLGGNEAIASGVAAGLGVGFLSRWCLAPYLPTGRLRIVTGLGLRVRRTFRWATSAASLPASAAHFREFAERNPPAPQA